MVKTIHEVDGVGKYYDFKFILDGYRDCKGTIIAKTHEEAYAKVQEYQKLEFPNCKTSDLIVTAGTIVI